MCGKLERLISFDYFVFIARARETKTTKWVTSANNTIQTIYIGIGNQTGQPCYNPALICKFNNDIINMDYKIKK